MTKAGYSHQELLLDRSGSMKTIKDDMEGALEQLLDDQRQVPGELTVGVRQFDTEYEVVVPPTDVNSVERITITPRGQTALLDALGKAITHVGEWLNSLSEDERPERVFFGIVTDGKENASVEWTRDQVFELIQTQTDQYGWVFTYMGANHDAIEEAGSIGIPAGQSLTYDASAKGVTGMTTSYSASIAGARRTGETPEFTDSDRKAAKG